jgi:hypothetical protein
VERDEALDYQRRVEADDFHSPIGRTYRPGFVVRAA